jgi:hypothetical protein
VRVTLIINYDWLIRKTDSKPLSGTNAMFYLSCVLLKSLFRSFQLKFLLSYALSIWCEIDQDFPKKQGHCHQYHCAISWKTLSITLMNKMNRMKLQPNHGYTSANLTRFESVSGVTRNNFPRKVLIHLVILFHHSRNFPSSTLLRTIKELIY